MALKVSLFFHLLGFGLLMSTLVGGLILHLQYKRAKEPQTKAILLKAMKPVGLLSPIGLGIMLITGITNMVEINVGILTLGWLTAKIVFFAIAAASGVLFSTVSRKRSALVKRIASGDAPPYADATLSGLDKQVTLFYVVMPVLLIIIVFLSVIGRLGGQ